MAKPVSTIDQIADAYRAHAFSLLRVDAGMRKDVLSQLKKLERELVATVQRAELSGSLTVAARQRYNAMIAEAKRTIELSYATINNKMQPQLMRLAELENQFISKTMANALSTPTLTSALSPNLLQTIATDSLIRGAPSSEWWGRQSATTLQRFGDVIRQGMAAGETNAELVRRVAGSRTLGIPGIMDVSRREAYSLVQSSVQTVANTARAEFYRENSDIIQGYVYHATLDNRTTQQCAALDGYMWDLEGNAMPGQGRVVSFQQPPLHWNCRSTLLPLMADPSSIAPGLKAELPEKTRASMDGPLTDQSFDEWLANKPASFQDDLLGPGKAKLFREGKATLLDMVDQSGRPLTLVQLEAKINE